MPENNQAGVASRALLPRGPNDFFVCRGTLLAGSIIVLAALAAYYNSFSGPFIFDDIPSITENPTIRHFQTALSPPHTGTPVGGRPVVNLSLAINYAAGGMQVWGYHAVNLAIHILAGLTLFGIVRRTLASRLAAQRSEISNLRSEILADATLLAFAVALLWTVHPLQTEVVDCVANRTESLMGLFYLATLYFFIRGVAGSPESGVQSPEIADNPTSRLPVRRSLGEGGWQAASVGACLLGMASKEVMASAPLMVLLYDRTFVAGTFRAAWRQRWRLYLGLGSTWFLLAYLIMGIPNRGGVVGFGLGITWWEYALTQCRAIVHYLRLSFWPHPLLLDYGNEVVKSPGAVAPQALILVMLITGTLISLWRWPTVGFVGIWGFAILAPSSSVIPLMSQTIAERRMYLPLAGVIALGVLGLYGLIGRRSVAVCFALAMGSIILTVQRNKDYHSAPALWASTVANCPGNKRARFNFGNALIRIPNRRSEAIAEYEAALRIDPGYVDARVNLAYVLSEIPDRWPEAIAQYETVLQKAPRLAIAHNNLANILLNIPGRLPEAIAQYEAALRIKPDFVEARFNLGNVLASIPGRLPDAIGQYEAALRIKPDFKEARQMLEAVQKTQAKNDREQVK